jgi:hypothetical protein
VAKVRADRKRLSPKLTTRARKRAIGEILEARFTLGAFEVTRRTDPSYWASPRNDMGRGIYGQAIREKRRLRTVPDDQLTAESAAARLIGRA